MFSLPVCTTISCPDVKRKNVFDWFVGLLNDYISLSNRLIMLTEQPYIHMAILPSSEIHMPLNTK